MDFVKRNAFWIAMGALAFVGGVVFAVVGLPARGKNIAMVASLQSEASKVAKAAARNDLPNPEWSKQAEQIRQQLQAQWERAMEGLKARDAALEQPFRDPLAPTEFVKPTDAGTWKDVYRAKIAALIERVRTAFPVSGSRPVVSKVWADVWPQPEEMKEETKRYWIQHYAIEAIAGLNKPGRKPAVPRFDSFQFAAQPERLLHATHRTMFQVVPFEIRLGCEFQSIPLVMSSLLNVPQVEFYVTSVDLERSQQAGSSRGGGFMGGGTGMPSPGALFDPGDPMMGGGMGVPFVLPEDQGSMTPRRRGRIPRRGPDRGAEVESDYVLPSTLVEVVLRGYVTDYIAGDEQEEQPVAE